MGCKCSCLSHQLEGNTEMLYGNFPNQTPVEEGNNTSGVNENDYNDDIPRQEEENLQKENNNNESPEPPITLNKNLKNKRNNPFLQKITSEIETVNSILLTQNLERTDSLFDLFSNIRTSPKTFEDKAKQYEVFDILVEYMKEYENPIALIKNPFYNLLLENSINNYMNSSGIEGLTQEIEKAEQIKEFDKKLYVINAPLNNPEEAIWGLIKNNRDNAVKEILSKKIDYLIISTYPIKNTENFKAFFLFLNKK